VREFFNEFMKQRIVLVVIHCDYGINFKFSHFILANIEI